MKTKSTIVLGTTVAFACATLAAGCAKPHAQAQKTLLKKEGATGPSGAAASYDPNLNGIEAAYKLYADPDGGLTQLQMKNIIAKNYKGLIDPSMISYLYNDPKDDSVQKLTLADIQARIPTLSWAAQGKPIPAADMDNLLLKSFPAASRTARDGVRELIARFDEKWTGGDADKLMSQNELLVPGAIMGLVLREDFSKGMPARFALSPQLSQVINEKVNQQLFGRYTVSVYTALPSDDQKLEWTQLLLRKQLLARQLKGFKTGDVAEADLTAFLATWDIQVPKTGADAWTKLFHLYDQATFFMGDQNGRLNQPEAFNLLTDLIYAKAASTAFDGNFNAAGAAKHSDKVTIIAGLYPKTAPTLLLDKSGHPNSDFWTSLGEGTSDIPAIVMALDAIGIDETLFTNYDANHDLLLQKAEAQAALTAMKVTNPTMLALLYPTDDKTLSPADLFKVIYTTEGH